MCGHVGIAGKLEYRDESLMKRLLVFDFFRGPDSTGLAAVTNTNIVKVAKAAVNPVDLFDMKKFADALSGSSSKVFLGHNRLATKGVVNNVNAHPYEYGNVVGAHNGTLDQKSWTALEEALGEKFAVDSQALICAIDRLGIEETVKLLQGAWALVWVNMSDPAYGGKPSLNFLRNKERPLWYSFSDKFDKIIWASEWHISHAATGMSAMNQAKQELHTTAEGHRFFSFKEDMHYRFDLEELKKGGETFPAAFMQELKGKEPTPVVHYQSGVSNFPGRNGNTSASSHSKVTTMGPNTTITKTGPMSKAPTVSGAGTKVVKKTALTQVELVGTTDQPYGGYITPDKVSTMLKYGCQWCDDPIDENCPGGVTIFEESGAVLCENCSGHDTRVTIFSNKSLEDLTTH